MECALVSSFEEFKEEVYVEIEDSVEEKHSEEPLIVKQSSPRKTFTEIKEDLHNMMK